MLSLCFSHVATVASPFRCSVFHFLAKLSEICEIFFLCEKKTRKLSLLHNNVNTSSHRGNLMALTAVYQFELWLKVWDMPSKLSLPRQGPSSLIWVKQGFQLSEVELTKFHCSYFYWNEPLSSRINLFQIRDNDKAKSLIRNASAEIKSLLNIDKAALKNYRNETTRITIDREIKGRR